MMRNVPLEERTKLASTIIPAKVLSFSSIFDESTGHIYTIYSLEELIEMDTLFLAIRGGEWNGLIELVNPSLKLAEGDSGLFFLNETTNLDSKYFVPAAGLLSFIKYDESIQKFRDPLNQFEITNAPFFKQFPIGDNPTPSTAESFAPPKINTIQPKVVSAGTETVITITGDNFGNSASGLALVEFRNPDISGIIIAYQSAPPDHILSWSNTQIQMVVPGRDPVLGKAGAGSGNIRLRNPNGEVAFSNPQITVEHNRYVDGLEGMLLIDDNGFGGYTFTYNHNFYNTPDAPEALERALETWQCTIHSNFIADGSTTSVGCPANDGINLLSFDNNCQLPIDLLAQTTQWFITCPNGTPIFLEMDLIFDANVNWYFGMDDPQSNQFDFESLVLHELGHAHGIGHVREPSSTMFPAFFPGIVKRDITPNIEECGNQIISESSLLNNCGGNAPFIPLPDCGLPCDLSVTAIQSSDCLIGEVVEYTLTIVDINGGGEGFNIFLDSIQINQSSYPYNVFGTTIIEIELPADGEMHALLVQDVEESTCAAEVIVNPPDCRCSMELNLVQISNCDPEDQVLYTLTIEDENGGSGFEILLNDSLVTDTPLTYSGTGSTFVDLWLPGDSLEQTIIVWDLDDTTCTDTIFQYTPDCQCFISLNAIQTGTCDEEDEVIYTLTVNDMNGAEEGFNLWIDGQAHPVNPFDYSNTGTTIFEVSIIGDGAAHSFQVEDINDPNCIAAAPVSAPDCACFLSYSVTQTGECDEYDEVNYMINVESINAGNSGFDVLIDGEIYPGSPFAYDSTNITELSLNFLADGSHYEIQLVDSEDSLCFDIQEITTPDCICDLNYSIVSASECTTTDSVIHELEIYSKNASTAGFYVFVNEELLPGGPFAFHFSDTTIFKLELPGDGAGYDIQVIDAHDNQCSDIQTLITEDCICDLSFSIEPIGSCSTADTLIYELKVLSKAGSPEGFNVWINGVLTEGSPFLYQLSDTTSLLLPFLANGAQLEIHVEDEEDGSCSDNQLVVLPDCICELSFFENLSSDCSATDSLQYDLNIISSNGSEQGFNVFIDGSLLDGSPFQYSPTDTNSLLLPVFGNGNIYEFKIQDVEDSECVDNQLIEVNNCICDLSFSIEQTIECTPLDSTSFELIVYSQNISSNGFELLVNGLQDPGSPFSYNISDTTFLNILLSGNANDYEIQIRDTEDVQCIDIQNVTTPDCICDLNFLLEQTGACDANEELVYTLIVNSQNGSVNGFNLLLDNNLVQGSPFAYDPSGTTQIDIKLPGDAANHILIIQDKDDLTCEKMIAILTPDCSCNLDFQVTQISDCENGGSILYEVAIQGNNLGVAGFNAFLDGTLLSGSPFMYPAAGGMNFSIPIEGDAGTHEIIIQDALKTDCQASTLLNSPDCICEVGIINSLFGDCDVNSDEIPISLTIEEKNGSSEGFHLWIDGVLHSDSPFDYESTGITNLNLLLPGDLHNHLIEIDDLGDGDCTSFVNISSPDCSCEISFDAQVIGGCDGNGFQKLELHVNAQNPSPEGFNAWINSETLAGSPFPYNPSGANNIDISLVADGSSYFIEIQDIGDFACYSSFTYESPDCSCVLGFSASQIGDCDANDSLLYAFVVQDLYAGQMGFNVLIDNVLHPESPFAYQPGGLSLIELKLPGDASNHFIEVIDNAKPDCIASIEVETPACLCQLSMEASQISDCNEARQTIWSIAVEEENGSAEGFDVFLNGENTNPVGYNYSPMTTFVNLDISGDGAIHHIEVVDRADGLCSINTDIQAADCQCSMWLEVNAISGCDNNGMIEILGSLHHDLVFSDSFRLLVDGFPFATPSFEYDGAGFTTFQFSLAGDGETHTIEVFDEMEEECATSTTIPLADCIQEEPDCALRFTNIQTKDCENGLFEVTLQFDGPKDDQRQYDFIQNGERHPQSPFEFHITGQNTLFFEADCDTLKIELNDLQIDDCQIDTTLFPTFSPGKFNLFPNPIVYQIEKLTIEGISPEDYDKLLPVSIFDILGRTLFEDVLLGKPFMTLDLSGAFFANGVYYFVMGADGKYHGKLIVVD